MGVRSVKLLLFRAVSSILSANFRPIAMLLSTTLILTGCGFTPLYQSQGNRSAPVIQELAAIAVDPIKGPDETARTLQTALRNAFPIKNSAPRYHLKLTANEHNEILLIRLSGDITRRLYRLETSFTLHDNAHPDSPPLLQNHAETALPYNEPRSGFAALQSLRDTRKRAANLRANEIILQLATYFRISQDSESPATATSLSLPHRSSFHH